MPTIVIDASQNLHVLYARTDVIDTEFPLASHDVSFFYSHRDGEEFGTPTNLYQGSGSVFSTMALDSNGLLSSLFAIDRLPELRCLEFFQGNATTSWSPQEVDQCNASLPSIATDPSGRLHVTFVQNGAVFYTYRDPGKEWSEPAAISEGSTSDEFPALAVSGTGQVHIIFYRKTSEIRQTLYYSTGSGSSFSSPQALRVLSRITGQVQERYLWPPTTPSLTVDAEGTCHLVFTSVFGQNRQNAHVLYMHNRGGNWSDAEAITDIGYYNRPSIVVDNDRNLHVALERFDGDWDIVYVQRRNGAWLAEEDLTKNNVDDLAGGGSGGRFIAVRDSALGIAYQTFEKIDPGRTSPAGKNEIAVLTTLLSPQPVLSITLDTIDFGLVRVGTCRDSGLSLSNTGTGILNDTGPPAITGGDERFSVTAGNSFAIAPGEQEPVRLQFCPDRNGDFEARLRITTNAGERIVILKGIGDANTTRYLLALDTVASRVGARFLMTMTITPAPDPGVIIDSFSLGIRYNSQALFFHGLINADGAYHTPSGIGELRIDRPPGTPLSDSILLQLEFEGLVTGKPLNRVQIIDPALLGVTAPIDTTSGIVYLEGCDIDRGTGFGRRIGVTSITPNPGSDQIHLSWRAPDGSVPELRIVDQLGRTVTSVPLPVGTGNQQEKELDLHRLEPGFYGLILIDQDEITSTPLMIVR